MAEVSGSRSSDTRMANSATTDESFGDTASDVKPSAAPRRRDQPSSKLKNCLPTLNVKACHANTCRQKETSQCDLIMTQVAGVVDDMPRAPSAESEMLAPEQSREATAPAQDAD